MIKPYSGALYWHRREILNWKYLRFFRFWVAVVHKHIQKNNIFLDSEDLRMDISFRKLKIPQLGLLLLCSRVRNMTKVKWNHSHLFKNLKLGSDDWKNVSYSSLRLLLLLRGCSHLVWVNYFPSLGLITPYSIRNRNETPKKWKIHFLNCTSGWRALFLKFPLGFPGRIKLKDKVSAFLRFSALNDFFRPAKTLSSWEDLQADIHDEKSKSNNWHDCLAREIKVQYNRMHKCHGRLGKMLNPTLIFIC